MRLLEPSERVSSLFEIDFDRLFRAGKRVLLFDLDNTLGGRRPASLSPDVVSLLEGLGKKGFRVGILTNRRRAERDPVVRELVGCYPVEHAAGKPSRRGFVALLRRLGASPAEAVMIGDRVLTDILGANLLGIHSIRIRSPTGDPLRSS